MAGLEQIRMPVEAQMNRYEQYVERILYAEGSHIAPMLRFVLGSRGKGIRPLIVMLSAGMFPETGPKEQRTTIAAMLVEMVHTASLIHDDIVDGSYLRRGSPSVKAMWGDHRAVLLGDYIIARAFTEGLQSGHYDILNRVTESMSRVCEGEMVQSYQSDHLDMTREIYLDISFKKTALILGVSSAVGAMAAGVGEADVNMMGEYGNNLGIAFQIRDDMLDYAPASQTGKPACGDLRERKINFPLLAVMEKADPVHRRTLIKKLSDVRRTPGNVEYLRRAVVEGGGIEEASRVMESYLDKSRAALAGYDSSPCRTSLFSLCDYIATREK